MASDGVYEVTAADLFCGAGGTSTGLVQAIEEIEQEYGIKVRLSLTAVNHWTVAIETHSANHQFAMHHCASLRAVKPKDVIPGPCDLLVASPECTHHSNARGGKPMDDQSRSSGDDVVRWIRELRPRMVIIENVREYRTWGPLGKNQRPIKSRRGEYFQKFLADIRALGYSTEDRLRCAADSGCPTTRIRLYIYCKLGGGTITWPEPTHAKDPGASLLPGLQKWRTAREDVIDWSDLGTSIFNRKKPLSPNTMRRIEAGLKKFSGIDLHGYLVKLYGTSTAASADGPVPTVTGQGGHIGLAMPFQIRTDCAGGKTAGVRGIDDPAATVVGSGGLGVVEPQAFIVQPAHGVKTPEENDDRRAKSADEPLGTATGSNEFALAQPFLLGQQTPASPRSTEEPVPTVAGKGAIAKVEPFMVAHFGERDGQEPRVHSVDGPTPAVTSRGAAELAQPFITEYHSDNGSEPRVKPVEEPLPTQDCANRFGLAQPYMMSAGGPEVGPRSVDDPAHTVLTRDHIGVATPFLAGAGGPARAGEPSSVDAPVKTVLASDRSKVLIVPVTHSDKPGEDPASRTKSVDEPLPTVTAAHRGELGMASPSFIVPQFSQQGPRSVDRPAPTVTTTSRGIGVATAFLVRYNGTSGPQSIEQPIGILTAKDRYALLVTFEDGSKCLLDILFRMLRPRELARAQSFPDSYQFSGKTEDIVKQIGNAVPVGEAKRLCKTALLQMRHWMRPGMRRVTS